MMLDRKASRLAATAALYLFLLLTPMGFVASTNTVDLAGRQSASSIGLPDTITTHSGWSRTPNAGLPDSLQSNIYTVKLGRPPVDKPCRLVPIAEPSRQPQPRVPGVAHSPISIRNDIDFANQALAEGWPGNGSSNNPYRIEGLDIKSTDIDTPCILISDTTVYFSIRHCTLRGGYWVDWASAVIVLVHASHGHLLNITCTSAGYGIVVSFSTLIEVTNSNCSSSTRSNIVVSDSTSVTLSNNTCVANSYSNIEILGGGANEVLNNTCATNDAPNIELFSSSNTVANNTLTGGGLSVYGTLYECRQALIADNTLNGKPLLFWQDQVGGTLPSGFGQAILVNCSQTTVQDTTVAGCSAGIMLMFCNETTLWNIRCEDSMYGLILFGGRDNLVVHNTFIHNGELSSGSGVSIMNSSYNVLGNNTFLNNSYGIILSGDYNYLWNNTFMGSTCGIDVLTASYNAIGGNWMADNAYGLYFSYPEASGNLIEYNIFINNGENAVDQYENQNAYGYNYWSTYYGRDEDGDGIGDIPYYVTGSNNDYDYHPLMLLPGSPVTWLEIPTDQYFPYGSSISYDLDATAAPPGIDQWWLLLPPGSTSFFTIDDYGMLASSVILAVGTYWVSVSVSDWMGNTITANFVIIVYEGSAMILQIPLIIFILATVAVVSTAAFITIIGVAVLRQRRAPSLPPLEPFGDKRPPVDQWNARCPLCGSHLFGDEGFCPGCGNRVTKSQNR
jgi:parallel beta-helix repeat protein